MKINMVSVECCTPNGQVFHVEGIALVIERSPEARAAGFVDIRDEGDVPHESGHARLKASVPSSWMLKPKYARAVVPMGTTGHYPPR